MIIRLPDGSEINSEDCFEFSIWDGGIEAKYAHIVWQNGESTSQIMGLRSWDFDFRDNLVIVRSAETNEEISDTEVIPRIVEDPWQL